jgi:hypothetical protein
MQVIGYAICPHGVVTHSEIRVVGKLKELK